MAKVKKMNKVMREKFKRLLLEEREKVKGDIKHLDFKSRKDSSGDLSSHTFHMADLGTDTFDKDMNLGLHGAEQEIMRQIDEALVKIKDRTYGNCEVCKKAITLKRLKVIPYAQSCLKCQKEMEVEKKI